MKRAFFVLGAAALVLAGVGCEQKSDGPSAGADTTKATSPSAVAVAAVSDDEISSEGDFEDEAEKDITADNLDAEIDKLDKEIGQ